jgi:lysophospholipid acyltransferase (LPLAT)-like uncharacterized protein
MIKKLIRSPFGNALVGWTIGSIIALLMITVRWRTVDKEKSDKFMASQDGIIMVFWHERVMAMPWLWPSAYALYALQSPHADGRMMSHAIGCFGVKTVWGSSNRNPLSGLRGLKRVLDRGESVAITPDGPRGPARKSALGPVAIAQIALDGIALLFRNPLPAGGSSSAIQFTLTTSAKTSLSRRAISLKSR